MLYLSLYMIYDNSELIKTNTNTFNTILEHYYNDSNYLVYLRKIVIYILNIK